MKKKATEILIDEIFAHREDYCEDRYITRDDCEKNIIRAINRYRYVFITGESGSGKTWLTKNILSKLKLRYEYINLSEIALCRGLIEYIKSTYKEIQSGRSETIHADAKLVIAEGGIEAARDYQINTDFLWEFIQKNKNKVVVFDNFESVIDERQILNDISCLITLADDPRMQKYNPKFLIIGAVNDVVRYFQTMSNYQTIASRIKNVTIYGFTDTETSRFVSKGFAECGFSSISISELSMKIHKLSGGLPQTVNELCYYIAIEHFDMDEKKIELDSEIMKRAEQVWISERMLAEYAVIKGHFTENITNNELLNYVLYSMSTFDLREFSSSEIRAQAEIAMGNNTQKGLSIKKVRDYIERLADATENRNILVKTNVDGYRIKSYKTKACLLLMLYIDNNKLFCVSNMGGV